MSKRINGSKFECAKHGIDYRILCEECGLKWAYWQKVISASIEDNNKKELYGTEE